MSKDKTEVKKRRGTSLPLLIGFLILGVIGYYAGPTIMIYAFYLQEKFIAASSVNVGDLPVKSTSTSNPTLRPGPDDSGTEAASAEASGASASGSDAGGAAGVPPTDAATIPSDAAPAEPDAK